MVKIFSAAIIMLFLIPVDLTFAQEETVGIKIYSGFFYKHHGKANPHDHQCSVEFKSPVSFNHQAVSVVPQELGYVVTFNNSSGSSKGAFDKYFIKIYTTDGEDYSIGPESNGHIYDEYLIYLILGNDINHLEVVSASPNTQDKYVLDKLEILDND